MSLKKIVQFTEFQMGDSPGPLKTLKKADLTRGDRFSRGSDPACWPLGRL